MKKKEKINLLDLIPYKSEHVTTEKEGELSVIAFPRFRSKFMQKYFVPKRKSPIIRIRLEAHGTAVWNLIDGNRTISAIIDALAEHFHQEENYEYRISLYLSQLYKQGFLRYKK